MTLPLSVSPSGRVAVATPAGEIDMATCGILRDALKAALGTPSKTVVVDLRSVTFADSSCLAVLADAAKALRAQGRTLVVANATRMPFKVLRLTGLTALMDVHGTPDALPAATWSYEAARPVIPTRAQP